MTSAFNLLHSAALMGFIITHRCCLEQQLWIPSSVLYFKHIQQRRRKRWKDPNNQERGNRSKHLQLPITFPLKLGCNLSLWFYAEWPAVAASWVGDKWNGCVHVCVWFMYRYVRVRRPSYRDHHLSIDTETLACCRPSSLWYISGTTTYAEPGLEGLVGAVGRGE